MEDFTDSDPWTEFELMETEDALTKDAAQHKGVEHTPTVEAGLDDLSEDIDQDGSGSPASFEIPDKPQRSPWLHCEGKVFHVGDRGQLSADGYLGTGMLVRLIDSDETYPGHFVEPVVELFGAKFVTGTALVHHEEKLFYLLRQQIFKLENMQSEGRIWPLSDDSHLTCLEARKQCHNFMTYVHYFITSSLPSLSCISHLQDYPHIQQLIFAPLKLRKHLEGLMLFLDRLSELPSAVFSTAVTPGVISSRLPPGTHVFHLYLDLKWNVIQALWELLNKQVQDMDLRSSELDDLTNSIKTNTMSLLWDLTAIAAVLYNKVGRNEALKTSPFPCACVCELWILLLHVMDHLSSKNDLPSFWSSLSCVLTEILSPQEQADSQADAHTSSAPSNFTCKDRVGFCWWLVVQVAPLYWYSGKGVYNVRKKGCVAGNWVFVLDLLKSSFANLKGCVAGNWVFVLDLLKSSFANLKEDQGESQRRFYLKCCLSLSQHWSANNGLMLWLWDYLSKRMNETFHIPSHTLHGLAIPSYSALQWMEQCYSRCRDTNRSLENENSFTLFLGILAVHLAKLLNSGTLQGWKQMKGRFYSKFYKRRMEEMSETGLHNFISLFLTLSSVADLDDVATQMCSFLDLLPSTRVLTWRGLFSLMLIHKEKKVDFGNLADKIAKNFTSVCKEFAEVNSGDKTRHRHLWKLIALYLDSTQEIFEHKNKQNLSDTKLLGEGFRWLFKACRENELRHLLTFIQSMLTVFRSRQRSPANIQDSEAALWMQVFPPLKKLISSHQLVKVLPGPLADTMAGFALLALERQPEPVEGTSGVSFLRLLKEIGLDDHVEASFCCRFLCHILPSSKVFEIIETESLQAHVIHTWFRCLVKLPPSHEGCAAFTRSVSKLPELKELLLMNLAEFVSSSEKREKSLELFMKSLGTRIATLTLYEEIIQFKTRARNYLGDVIKYIDAFLSNEGPQDSLRLSFLVTGSLTKYCYKIVYSRSTHQCLLREFLDKLILPLPVGKKEASPVLQQTADEYLQLGLACLDFKKDEFIKTKIKDIFVKYFKRVCQKHQAALQSGCVSTLNPFLVVLQGSFDANPSQAASDFRHFVVEIIMDKFLNLRQSHKHVSPILFFLVQLIKKTRSAKETARNAPLLLTPALACIMACNNCSPANEPPRIRRQAVAIIHLSLESCRKTQDMNYREVLLPCLGNFVFQNILQNKGLVFKAFQTIGDADSDLLAALIPSMKKAVIQCEQRRGVGADLQLRSSFKILLQRIGKAADAEWESSQEC